MIGPFGTVAFGEPFTGPDLSSPNPFDAYLSDVNAQLIYLVELYPYDAALPQTMAFPLPVGVGALGETDVTYWGGVAPVYLSDMGFTTLPGDVPASTYFIAQVDNPVQIETSILNGNGFGSGSQSFGSISIANGNGRLDYLENYGWAGRRAVVKAGIPGFAYSQFAIVFDGAVNSIESDEERITLTIRDNRVKVDQLLSPPVYAGTGGLEGGTDLAGKVKPLCYGVVNNIEPVLVDAANLIYQLHDGSMQWVDEVRDNGVALGNSGDVPDIIAATVPAGTFKTSLDKGYIKLGSTPAGRITADARGETKGGYVSTAGDIAKRLVTTRLGALSLLETDVDSGSLAAMNAAISGSVGIYLNDRTTAASVLDDLIAPLGAYWTFNRQGQLFAGVVDQPVNPTLTITADMIEEGGVRVADTITPAWRLSVGYAPSFTVQAESELAGATDAIDRAFVTQEYRYVTVQDEAVRAQNKQAVERVLLTRLAWRSHAEKLLVRLQSLYAVQRRVYRVSLHRSLFRLYIGNSVRLVYDRFGLSAGINLLVIGIAEDAETGLTTLDLWG